VYHTKLYISLNEFIGNISVYLQVSDGGHLQSLSFSSCTHCPDAATSAFIYGSLLSKEPAALSSYFAECHRCPKILVPSRHTLNLERGQSLQGRNMVNKGE
jgi:hypothetical protein